MQGNEMHTLDPSGTTDNSSMACLNIGAGKNLSGNTSAGLIRRTLFVSDRFKTAAENA